MHKRSLKVQIHEHPLFGRSAFAAQAIRAGDTVICETPLLFASTEQCKVLDCVFCALQQALLQYSGLRYHPEIYWVACAQYVSFLQAPDDVQRQVLQECHNQADIGIDSSCTLRQQRQIAQLLASISSEVAVALADNAGHCTQGPQTAVADSAARVLTDPADIEKVLLAFELNAHHTDAG